MTRNFTSAALTLAFLAVPAVHAATYGSTAIVATSGGDYTDPAAAIADVAAWCGTASDTNRCQVKIMPGNYPLTTQLVIPGWVDIAGAGRHATVLEGSGGTFTPGFQVLMTEHSEIRSLTLRVTGWYAGGGLHMGGDPSRSSVHTAVRDIRLEMSGRGHTGIKYWYGAPIIENSDIVMDMQGDQKGIYGSYGSPQIFGVNVTMSGTSGAYRNYGMDLHFSGGAIRSSTVKVSDGTRLNAGIVMRQSATVLEDVEISATGSSSEAVGLVNAGGGGSNSKMIRVRAEAYGNTGYGVVNDAPASTSQLVQSWVSGSTAGVLTKGGHVSQISQTQINGGVTTENGTSTCVAVVDGGTHVFYQNTCP